MLKTASFYLIALMNPDYVCTSRYRHRNKVSIGYAYPASVILGPCYLNVFKYFEGFNGERQKRLRNFSKIVGHCVCERHGLYLRLGLSSTITRVFFVDNNIRRGRRRRRRQNYTGKDTRSSVNALVGRFQHRTLLDRTARGSIGCCATTHLKIKK